MKVDVSDGGFTRTVPGVRLYYRLTASQLPALQTAIGNGVDVACVNAEAEFLESAGNSVFCFGLAEPPGYLTLIQAERFLDLIEVVFEALGSQSKLLSWLHRLYNSSDIDYYFRRVLQNELGSLLGVASLASSPPLAGYASIVLTGNWPGGRLWPIFLILWRQDDTRTQLKAHLSQPICGALDRLTIAGGMSKGIAGEARRYALAFYYVVRSWCFALRRLRLRPYRLPSALLVFRTYATDTVSPSFGRDKLRDIDFIVRETDLPVKGVAVWVEPGTLEERQAVFRERGYQLLKASDVVFTPAAFIGRVLPTLLSYTALIPGFLRDHCWWYPSVGHLVNNYLLWDEVCRQVKPAVFIAYNDTTPDGIARNIVLGKHACCTVFYQHSCSNLIIRPDGSFALNMVHPYLVFDAIATWGKAHRNMFRSHPGHIDCFWEVGCLWSEHARLVGEGGKLTHQYLKQLTAYAANSISEYQARVGVFDNTAGGGWLAPGDAAAFYEGIVRLARRLPKVFFICKPKASFEESLTAMGQMGDRVRKAVADSTNVVLLPNDFETGAVVGLTDLIVAARFTSVVVEAIGCGKPAIYYDPTNGYPPAFWYRIPGMVCVTDEELYERVCYLLWGCDDETYTAYLRTYLSDFEGYFDGRAITRLRDRLLERMNGIGRE